MTLCEGVLRAVVVAARDQDGWRCTELGDGRAMVDTGRTTADSEPVRLYVSEPLPGMLAISDGGETLARLVDQGFDMEDQVHQMLWEDGLYAYRLTTVENRIYADTSLERAPYTLRRMADGLVALNGMAVAVVPATVRRESLADEVEGFLKSQYTSDRVQRSPNVRLLNGLTIKPALRVITASRPVLVQPGAATSPTQSYDHAHTLFSLAARGGLPMDQRLVVLGGGVESWNAIRIRLLAEVAFVGFWRHRELFFDFLEGTIPDDAVMAPPGFDVPMVP